MNKIDLQKNLQPCFFMRSYVQQTNKKKEKTLSDLLPRITMFIEYKTIHTILTKEV